MRNQPDFNIDSINSERFLHFIQSHIAEWKTVDYSTFSVKETIGLSNLVVIAQGKTCNGQELKIVVKIYGKEQESFLKRKDELECLKLATSVIGGPKIISSFENGRFEEYIEAKNLSCDEMRNPAILKMAGRKMASLHMLKTGNESDFLVSRMRIWQNMILKLKSKLEKNFEIDWIDLEITKIENKKFRSPIVLCHNDTHHGNFMMDLKRNDLILIDYEFAHLNYRGFDLGNTFVELMADYDSRCSLLWDKFPTKEEQAIFLEGYLGVQKGHEQIEDLINEAREFIPVSLLFWGIWQIMMALKNPNSKYDYLEAGKSRLEIYKQICT